MSKKTIIALISIAVVIQSIFSTKRERLSKSLIFRQAIR